MFYIKIADINICIVNKYEYVRKLCTDYIIEKPEKVDMTVEVFDGEIDKEISDAEVQVNRSYAEGVCTYRKICKQLPELFNSYLFHSAVIEYEGNGYAFAARSGTGKSTHIALWQKRFGEEVRIINGDKPIMRFGDDGKLYAYGTPWCGKEGFNINASVPLKAICFIERAKSNSIRRISADEALMRLFHQILAPSDLATVDSLIPLLDRTLREIPCFLLGCNISEEAAEVAYRGMNQE